MNKSKNKILINAYNQSQYKELDNAEAIEISTQINNNRNNSTKKLLDAISGGWFFEVKKIDDEFKNHYKLNNKKYCYIIIL